MQNFVVVLVILFLNANDISINIFVSASDDVYEGCGKSRFCFGISSDRSNEECIYKKNCDMVTSILVHADVTNIRLQGGLKSTEGYIALGFSTDTIMKADLCVICVREKSETHSFFTWNPEDGSARSPYIDPATLTSGSAPSLKKHSSKGKDFFCEVEISSKTTYHGFTFDLNKSKYFTMLARGEDSSDRYITNHYPDNRWVSRMALSLLDSMIYHGTAIITPLLDKIHGILMAISFVFFMSLGAFVGRFYKETLIEIKVWGRKFWFLAHMVCMYCSVAFAFSSLIVILVARIKLNRPIFPTSGKLMNHVYVGLTALTIMLFQSTLIWWNPSFRKTLTLFHSLFGVLTFYLGWYCVTFSAEDTNRGPINIIYIGISWIIVFAVFYIGMTFLQLWVDRIESPDAISSDRYRALKVPMKITSLEEDPNSCLKIIVLIIFTLVLFALMLAATVLVGLS